MDQDMKNNVWDNIYEIVKDHYTREQVYNMTLDELYEILDSDDRFN